MNSDKTTQIMHKLTYASSFVLALFLFTSFSISALHHILLIIPGGYFFWKNLKNKNLNVDKLYLSLFAFTVICALSILVNWQVMKEPIRNLIKLKYFIIPLLGYFAWREWFENCFDKKKVRLILNLFMIGATIATVSGLIGLYTGFNPLRFKAACHETRACGMYGMYMSYGYGISLFTTLLATLIFYRKKLSAYLNINLLYTSFFINLLGVYLAGARGAWLGFLASIPFLFFYANKKKFMIGGLASILVLASLFHFSPRVKKAFTGRSDSNAQRVAFWNTALHAYKEKPILGYGYKNFEPYVKEIKKKYNIEYPDIEGHAHSNFLEAMATTGSAGFILFLLFQILWFLKSPYLQAFVVNFFVSGQVQVTFGDGENVFLIMFIFLVSLVIKAKKKTA